MDQQDFQRFDDGHEFGAIVGDMMGPQGTGPIAGVIFAEEYGVTAFGEIGAVVENCTVGENAYRFFRP